MTRVLVLLEREQNRRLMAGELEALGGYETVLPADGEAAWEEAVRAPDFDVCLLDGLALDRLRGVVAERKALDEPLFLPFVLITPRGKVGLATGKVWEVVDEVLVTPVEKAELRARLEVLGRARSLSLSLRDRAREAERATRLRDEVLAMVSHDLRNPLDVILSSGSFLLEEMDDLQPASRKMLEAVHRSAERMNRLIGDLLDVSGLEAGQVSLDRSWEQVEPLVRGACAGVEHVAEERGIFLSCRVEEGLPTICVDRHRIDQVLDNLLGNALKFTPEGGEVRVAAERSGADGEEAVRISVADSGRGMSQEEVERVFDRFWQAEQSKEGGAGLGLAIARGFVEAHGGSIAVESAPGEGSTFTLVLPVKGLPRDR